MPTSKQYRGYIKKKPPVYEIKLEVPSAARKQSAARSTAGGSSPSINPKRSTRSSVARIYYEPCGTNVGRTTGSVATVSVQNLKFPDVVTKPKPTVCVKDTSSMTLLEDISHPNLVNYISSNMAGIIFDASKKFRRKCSSDSSTIPEEASIISSSISSHSSDQFYQRSTSSMTSQAMLDSEHQPSQLKEMNLKGPEWRKPCKESFIAGAPRPYIGNCPTNLEAVAKMSKERQKFFMTQDPRKKYCLRNPNVLRAKAYTVQKEFEALTKMVKHADNICAHSESDASEPFICEVIDADNPMQLDLQGLDYTATYQNDEQDDQNQRLYRRIVRHMDRKRVKAEMENVVESELQNDRLAVPDCFAITNRSEDIISIATEESVKFGKLYRANNKPYNKEIMKFEKERRNQRYKDLYLNKKARNVQEREKEAIARKKEEEEFVTTIANKNFEEALQNINDAIDRATKKDRLIENVISPRPVYPHTTRETDQLRKKLKVEKRIDRDIAKVKQEFFLERRGKVKKYKEADLEISSDTPQHSHDSPLSEQSTDDEDNIEVGKKGETFKLRGFHFKLGENLRGKRHERELLEGRGKERSCITREQWLAKLVPKKDVIKLDIEAGIVKERGADDPNMLLFPPTFNFKPAKVKSSAIREYILKRLGRHYDRTLRKNLKLAQPRLKYSVKKFNLISFLYGDDEQRQLASMTKTLTDLRTMKLNSTMDYVKAKETIKRQKKKLIKQKRLELLGVPCVEVKKSRLQTLCENSESDKDSDWVPEREPHLTGGQESTAKDRRKSERVPLRMRGNMPAPKYRETTLRKHPRHPRDYAAERVPSLLFDETVRKTGIPHLHKLQEDEVQYANIRTQKRPYTKMLEARHHHDHWNPTQKKAVNVYYQADIVKPHITKVKGKADKKAVENFRTANPPCNAFVDMDLTKPKWDLDSLIKETQAKKKRNVTEVTKERTENMCKPYELIYHSRPAGEVEKLDFPGHQEYVEFLHEIRTAVNKKKNQDDGNATGNLFVDKEALIKELEEDLDSIDTCLTSLSSSECTNLTNDSGSYIEVQGQTKVPLDYIRKSLVPFVELQRSRFHVEPIDVDAEDANPFKVLPFCGQKKAQLQLKTGKDNFFTFNSRLRNGLRLRLEVPTEDVRKTLIGRGIFKFHPLVVTDLDQHCNADMKHRPPVKNFQFKTGSTIIKDALRLKFESLLIQGKIVRTKIYDRINELHWENMEKMKMLYEALFAKWEKKEYDAAMAVVHRVKSFYDLTDDLKREYREQSRMSMMLVMDIVFIEGSWIRRIMLQNFHYLMGDQEWRHEHDWIHRINDDELESFEESIAKRSTCNIRERGKDDAWAIKAFFENVYLKNKHPILIVYPDAESFQKGIENLKLKTFVLLLELHFTLSIHTELQGRLETFEEWCKRDLLEKRMFVDRKCARQYFMEDRAVDLRKRTMLYLDQPIEKTFNNEVFNKERSLITEVWRQIVPKNLRGSGDQEVDVKDMVAMMMDIVVDLIGSFESIPVDEFRAIELKIRKDLAYRSKISAQAYQIEKRIEMEMKKVKKNLEPPYKKPRHKKLPRCHIVKKEIVSVEEERRFSEQAKFFFRAFHDESDVMQMDDARENLYVIDTIQEQIVPFYFDYFLKLNGYTPNYNFKTQIELRDGPELDRLQVRSVIPEIQAKMDNWEFIRKKTMEENITRNPKMYENVS